MRRGHVLQSCPMCGRWKPSHESACGLAVFERRAAEKKARPRARPSRMDGIELAVKGRTAPQYPKTGWIEVTPTGTRSLDLPTPEETVHDLRAANHVQCRERFVRCFDLYERYFNARCQAIRAKALS